MKPPAMESAVHTTPPIIMAAVMPLVPLNPALTSTSEVRMSVISVIAVGALVLILPYQTAMLSIRLMGLAIIVGGIEDLTATACTVNTKKNGTVIDVDDFWEV